MPVATTFSETFNCPPTVTSVVNVPTPVTSSVPPTVAAAPMFPLPVTSMFSETFNCPATVTSSGNPIVTVEPVALVSISFAVPEIVTLWVDGVAVPVSPANDCGTDPNNETAPDVTEKSVESKLAIPFTVVDESKIPTAPELTVKVDAGKLATPFTVFVASTPEMVSVFALSVVVIPVPSPETKLNVSPSAISNPVPLFAARA